jgi:hypothetical protein
MMVWPLRSSLQSSQVFLALGSLRSDLTRFVVDRMPSADGRHLGKAAASSQQGQAHKGFEKVCVCHGLNLLELVNDTTQANTASVSISTAEPARAVSMSDAVSGNSLAK